MIEIIDLLKPKNGGSFKLIEDIDVAVNGYSSLADCVAHMATTAMIDAINAVMADKANVSDVATVESNLQSQIDNIIEPVTEDAEVINSRVGYDGQSYPTLKNRIDTEIRNVNNEMKNYFVDDICLQYGFVNGRLDTDGSVIDISDMLTIAEYVPVNYGDYIILSSDTSTYTLYRATYDSSYNLIEYRQIDVTVASYGWVIPEGTAYFKFSISRNVRNSNYHVTNYYKKKSVKDDELLHDANVISDVSFATLGGTNYNNTPYEIGLLDNTGTVTPNDNFYTTAEYIPVNMDERLVFSAVDNTTYTLFRADYDSNYELVNYYVITVNTRERYLDYNPAVAYIKYSVSRSAMHNLSVYKQPTSIDGLTKQNMQFDFQMSQLDKSINCVDFVKQMGFVKGAVSTVDGSLDETQINQVTIGDYIPVIYGERLIIDIGIDATFTLKRAFYNKNKEFVSGTTIEVTHGQRIYDVQPDVYYVRYSVSYNTYKNANVKIYIDNELRNGDLHLLNLVANNEVCQYTGENLNLDIPKSLLCTKLFPYRAYEPTGKSFQGIEVFNKYYFQFMADNYCRIHDISNKGAVVGEYEVACGHGNSACFSNIYQTSDAEFPLCFVSDITGIVNLVSLSKTTSTVIKSFFFPSADCGYVPQFAIDNDNNIGYTVANSSDSSVIRTATICKFNMANLTDNGDGTYTPELIDKYTLDISGNSPVLQGVKFLNGCLYICSGDSGNNDAFIAVVDTTSKTIKSTISFPDSIKKEELEDIAFIPNLYSAKYDIIANFRTNGVYKLSL